MDGNFSGNERRGGGAKKELELERGLFCKDAAAERRRRRKTKKSGHKKSGNFVGGWLSPASERKKAPTAHTSTLRRQMTSFHIKEAGLNVWRRPIFCDFGRPLRTVFLRCLRNYEKCV